MSATRTAVAATVRAVIVLAVVVPTAWASEREQPHAGARCVAIEDASARLACYDQAFDRPAAKGVASAAAAEGVAPAAAAGGSLTTGSAAAPAGASSEAARAIEEFGLTETSKRRRDPEKAKETMPESISASVVRVSFRPTGEVVVALDNDQVWEQAEIVTTQARVKKGDAVTIRKSALGSYTLLTPSRMVVRVRRVR